MRTILFGIIALLLLHNTLIAQELVWATYLGGSGWEDLTEIALDSQGNLILAGNTNSTDFPTTKNALKQTLDGPSDLFVVKLNSDGMPDYSTFIGSNSEENALDMHVDPMGAVYILGQTRSNNFPVTESAFSTTPVTFQTAYSYMNSILFKLKPDGSTFDYSTYFWGRKMDVDAHGNVYVTGSTGSESFPTTENAFDKTYNGNNDGFVSKLNAKGNTLLYSTFLGGNGQEEGHNTDIIVDKGNCAYVATTTFSSDYPVTPDAFNPTFGKNNNEPDIVITKLNNNGSNLIYSTYLASSYWDSEPCLALAETGHLFITGCNLITGGGISNFPTTSKAYDTKTHRHYSSFVSKFNPEGQSLDFSTFFGGDMKKGFDIMMGCDLAIDEKGYTYIAGEANTYQGGIPLSSNAIVKQYQSGDFSYFLAVLNETGSHLIYSTYLGVKNANNSVRIVHDQKGHVYIAGKTKPSKFPVTTNCYDASYNGGDSDIFVMKIKMDMTSDVSENILSTPDQFQLHQNYPNPFNPSTTIRFDLAKPENVQLKIFNLHGQEIQTLVDNVLSAGEHSVRWQADGLPGGIYLAQLQTGSKIKSMKLVLQK